MHKLAHFVITIWRLGEVETKQVVRFGTVLPVTHHQLASLSAAETEVLVCVFALWPQLPLFRLQLGVPGFLLLLHHHCTLDQTSQKERHQKQASKSLECSRDRFEEVNVLTVGCTPRNPEQLSDPQLQDVLLLPTQWRL